MSDVSQLVMKAQAGDLGSYETIVQRFQASAFSHAFSVLGDSGLAQDAVQEAFITAHRNLPSLQTPEAFPTWFRKLVFTACNRINRRKAVPSMSLEAVAEKLQSGEEPIDRIERAEREQMVHLAIQALPDSLRMVTGLYYIGGMTQREIATYLEHSESVVKKRLFNARQKLKETIMNMAEMISDERMPADQVSAKVIAELVSSPQPLLINNHPISVVVEQIKTALPDYQLITGREVEEKAIYPSIQDAYSAGYDDGYHLDAKHILRTQMSGITLRSIEGQHAPIRLFSAGRVYRAEQKELNVFHQLDGICIDRNVSIDELRHTLQKLLSTVLGVVEMRYRDQDFGWVDQSAEVEIKVNNKWIAIAGYGMLKPAMLNEAGHDPALVSGYAFGLGLERLAMTKLGLKSVHELWLPPYLQVYE